MMKTSNNVESVKAKKTTMEVALTLKSNRSFTIENHSEITLQLFSNKTKIENSTSQLST